MLFFGRSHDRSQTASDGTPMVVDGSDAVGRSVGVLPLRDPVEMRDVSLGSTPHLADWHRLTGRLPCDGRTTTTMTMNAAGMFCFRCCVFGAMGSRVRRWHRVVNSFSPSSWALLGWVGRFVGISGLGTTDGSWFFFVCVLVAGRWEIC